MDSMDQLAWDKLAWASLPASTHDPVPLSQKAHRFVEKVRAGVVDYRSQSLSHFSLHINVRPSECLHTDEKQFTHDFQMKLVFENYSQKIRLTCRPQHQRGFVTSKVQVREKGRQRWRSLQSSLEIHFPASAANVTIENMRDWWGSNRKSFNWAGLATELKETILQFCMRQPPSHDDYLYEFEGCRRLRTLKPRKCEIVHQLGPWAALLRVSAEVRKLTLQLCFRGSWLYPNGLSIMSDSNPGFRKSINRLGKYYQILERDSVPNASNQMATVLARHYMLYPKVYRELSTYATFMHGIRKVYLGFDFWSSLHFFKVSVYGINYYRPSSFMTCDIFERLPQLNAIYIFLPTKERLSNGPPRLGPKLFHDTHPCPRSLHRLIYEHAAKELAPYEGVHMKMFIDKDEEDRFVQLHAAAKSSLPFTNEELAELWEDCDGGVQLGMESDATRKIGKAKRYGIFSNRAALSDINGSDTLTPFCKCTTPCFEAYEYAGHYARQPRGIGRL